MIIGRAFGGSPDRQPTEAYSGAGVLLQHAPERRDLQAVGADE
jgi:hypothetical protein